MKSLFRCISGRGSRAFSGSSWRSAEHVIVWSDCASASSRASATVGAVHLVNCLTIYGHYYA